jgi:hypothetical protein
MKTRSRMRTVPLSTRSAIAGAISPLKSLSGKPTTMYSTGPMLMTETVRTAVAPAITRKG